MIIKILFITTFLNFFKFIHSLYNNTPEIIKKLNSYKICNKHKCKYINNNNNSMSFINEPILTSTNNFKFLSDSQKSLDDNYLYISNYYSNISIIDYGKHLNETIILNAQNLPIDSDKIEYKLELGKLNISNLQITMSPEGKYSYIRVPNNIILFKFQLKNKKSLTINLLYDIINTDYYNYYRKEYFSIPDFANDGLGEMYISLPSNFVVLDNNNYELKNINNNVYYWNGKIPKKGFEVIFKLTIQKGKFRVKSHQEILTSSNYIKNVKITIPKYYIGGNLDIIEYNVETNEGNEINSTYIKMNDENIIFNFNDVYLESNNFYYEISGIVESNVNNKYKEKLIKEDYYKIEDENVKEMFANIANKILSNYYNYKNNKNETEYQILAKWVNEYMIYDINLLGIDFTPLEILENKKGVCHHFTILLNTLLNSINIPSISVIGMFHDGYVYNKNFELHEWSLVYYNNKWIPIDATNGFYNGLLPISFIYQGYDKIEIEMSGELDEINFGEDYENAEYIEK